MKKKKLISLALLLLALCLLMAACSSAEANPGFPAAAEGRETEATETPREEGEAEQGEESPERSETSEAEETPGTSEPSETPGAQETPSPGGNQPTSPSLSPEAEFLSQFPTLFSFEWGRNAGALYNFEWDGNGSPWFDREGNRIEAPSFLREGFFVPFRYYLYHLTSDARPEILILWGLPQSSEMWYAVYRYIDGAYREIGGLPRSAQLFRDNAGRLVMLENDPWYYGVMSYDYVELSGSGMTLRPIISVVDEQGEDGNWRSFFRNHITGETLYFEGEEWPCEAWTRHHASTPTSIFGMPGEALTSLSPLTDLQNSVNASVRAKLGL